MKRVHPLTLRLIVAGVVLIVAGLTIAVTRAGVGEQAMVIGGLVAAIGTGLVVSGLLRFWKGPE